MPEQMEGGPGACTRQDEEDVDEEAERGEISTRARLTNDASLHMPHLPSRFPLKPQTCLYEMRTKKNPKTFCTFFPTTFLYPLQPRHPRTPTPPTLSG